MTTPQIELTGSVLTLAQLVALQDGGLRLSVPERALQRVGDGHTRLVSSAAEGSVYGANTGVGANKSVAVTPADQASHASNLLLSHCAAVGPLVPDAVARIAMGVRLNQLLIGRSGVSREIAQGLVAALTQGVVPTIHSLGTIGTGDIAQLAELALTLTGMRPWKSGDAEPVDLQPTDALPFMSSSAFTLAQLAVAANECRLLLAAAEVAATLTLISIDGCDDAWDPRVHRLKPHPSQEAVASRLWTAVHDPTRNRSREKIQDAFSLRSLPLVQAAADDALARLIRAVELECASSSENPLSLEDGGVPHHGMFHLATLAGLVDHARATLLPVLALNAARISLLNDPRFTGARPFLADDKPGSSGLMIDEYVAQDVLAQARGCTVSYSTGASTISLGVEDHASFAPQGAQQLMLMCGLGRILISLEVLAAVRTIRQFPSRRRRAPADETFAYLDSHLSVDQGDKPIGDDIERLGALIWELVGAERSTGYAS